MTWNELLKRMQLGPRDAEAFERLAGFLRTAPADDIEQFASSVVESMPAGGTFLGATLSHVSEPAMARLVDKCMALLESGQASEACEAVLAYASLQMPRSLRPQLQRLFVLRPNSGTYYEDWLWRGAEAADIQFLIRSLEVPGSREKALQCLLETRRSDAMSAAVARAEQIDLREVGFDTPEQRLYQESCQHIVFAQDYFADDRPAWNSRSLDPTWRLQGAGDELRFGGAGSGSCGLCGETLHHVISLPSSHVFGDGDHHSIVRLETCLSCLGWAERCLFYQHAADDAVSALDVGSAEPEFVAEPLLETRVRLAPTPDRWKWQDWALSNARENLNRIGGYPCWIQSADFPACKSCNRTMHFFMQLDSDLPTAEGGEWRWGSGGICYGFSCKDCRITAFHWQCT